ncbi:MAG: ABC transporter ATP-binding protein [Candidatus Woesearchaeota archaeon]
MHSDRRCSKQKVDLKYTLKVFWSFVRKYRWLFYGIIFMMFLNELVHFFDNFLFKYLIDKATLFNKGQIDITTFSSVVLIALGVYLGVKLVGAVIWFFTFKFINRLESKVMNDIENKSFWHIINLSYRFHINKRTGSLISKFTRGVSKVESFTDAVIFNFAPSIFRLILSFGVVFYLDIPTAIALMIMCVVFVLMGIIATSLQRVSQDQANDSEDELKHNLSDVFINIETVKYFAKEELTHNYFSRLSQKLKDARRHFWDYFSWYFALEAIIFAFGFVAIFYLSFSSFRAGKIGLGDITLIYTAVLTLIPQLFSLMHGYRNFIRSSVDVSDLFAMFKEENEVKDVEKAPGLKVGSGEIEFNDVCFSYPRGWIKKRLDQDVLIRNFSLFIHQNTKVAIVGPSGSGKTTIVKLLYRLFDLNSGEIKIDGQDISHVTQESLRDSMSIVPQEPLLFNNTIYFNVAYAHPKASEKEVWKAIKMARLDTLINRLPQKEKTEIGERGVKLSGGEKQRISIARALLANKKILVLDEATSSLDSETEREIQKDLDVLMLNRTTIMIAHRLSTIMNADLIVVLDQGKVVEMGTHQQLLKLKKGLYRRLWEIQQGLRER